MRIDEFNTTFKVGDLIVKAPGWTPDTHAEIIAIGIKKVFLRFKCGSEDSFVIDNDRIIWKHYISSEDTKTPLEFMKEMEQSIYGFRAIQDDDLVTIEKAAEYMDLFLKNHN